MNEDARSEARSGASAELHAAILDAMPVSIALLDASGTIVLVNESWRRFGIAHGVSPAGAGGGVNYIATCERAAGNDCTEGRQVAAGLREILSGTRESFDLDYPCHSPEEKRWFRVLAAPVGRATTPDGAVVIHIDITERKLVLEAAQMHAHILNSIGDAVIASDPEGKVIYMNRAAEHLYGWPLDEARGRHVNSINVPQASSDQALAIMESVRSGHTWSGEFAVHNRAGRSFPIEATLTALREHSGAVTALIGVSRDISARKQAEEQIRLGQSQVEEAQELAQMGGWEWDIGRGEVIWSDATAAILGVRNETPAPEEFFLKNVHPEDRARVEQAMAATVAQLQPYDCLFRIVRPDGSRRTLRSRGRTVREENGQPIRIVGMVQDVTEQEAAAEALRQSERRFRQLAENIDDVFWILDLDPGQSIYVSPAYDCVWGQSREELRTNPWAFAEAVVPEDRPVMAHFLEDMHERNCEATYRIRRPDGTVRWIFDRAFPLRDANGRVYRVAGIAHDITEQKETAAALAQHERELRALAGRANEAREEEAVRISRELHDELGQALTALTIDVASVQRQFEAGARQGVGAQLQQIQERLNQTIKTTRRICTDLRPPMLDQLGLAAAIEWQSKEFEGRTGILCDLLLPCAEHGISRAAATATFRILQEVLTNIARHAHATAARVELTCTNEELRLEVSDNGRGASPEELARRGALGLLGMRERAAAVGGEVKIKSSERRGMTVTLIVPLNR